MPLEIQIAKKLPDFALDMAFTAGEAPLGILGPSGAGKTMLLRCVAGLERPDRGRIALDGRILLDTERRILVPARDRRVGMLFQHYALFPHCTVAENVAFGLRHLPRVEQEQRVTALLDRAHIGDLRQRYPRDLSGGEQQRAALARALAIQPEALLLDEPLSALDTHLRSQMETQLQETFAAYRRPALLVTHNIEEAYRLGEQLLVLSRGRVAAFGPKEEVFRRPPSLEVARLTGCKNFSRARAISENQVEALDWGCRLRVTQSTSRSAAHIGIRAHHIDFVESSRAAGPEENVFPCWLVRSSETPFRITLYLRLHQPPGASGELHREGDLQAEVFKEKWQLFRERPLPWHVRLPAESLFVMPD
ncbi:MAG TPA: sulfate/molybdate ABC transporter ATP-binding protein [Candidatus Acidoferrales bacterium]|nr:sulfate/molybdate ABC transporter ATP-binding protein [Candidatus Acidoferrales bacterium]